MPETITRPTATVLIDAHVHLHRSFPLDEFLDHAQQNLTRAAARIGSQSGAVGILALTEGPEEHAFERLRESRHAPLPSGWRVERTREETSLVAKRGGGMPLALIAGQQIRLRHGLELLAVGCNPGLEDGGTLQVTLGSIRDAGAMAVLPWGFGKWWLRRGRLVEGLLAETPPDRLLLADSGTRPALSREPRLLGRARRLGFRILAGSDPLPLAGEVARPGSFGCLTEGGFSVDAPAASLRELLSRPASLRIFGSGRPLRGFLRDQIAMQLRKRRS